ncbi:hypothetical protein [Persephonella sp.]|uniref:hypothetical protein n=1 Tax=Persephonella sp. TaxID=2060922 RepID=UPI002620824F|nr:hypothetical protein [Persephonella sp.]
MEEKNIENTLKKMAIVLDKVVKKVDELDKRITKLEMKLLAEEGKKETTTQAQSQQISQPESRSASGIGNFGTGFLSSLFGTFAGMSLFNLLFNNNISAHEVAQQSGLSEDELSEIDHKLDELSQEISQIDEKLDEIDQSIDEITDNSIEPDITDFGFDDFGTGFDDIDMV